MMNEVVIGSCGLACMLCSAKLKGECHGCDDQKAKNCQVKTCCIRRKIDGCYQCSDYPCNKDIFKNHRVNAFIECAKELGLARLGECLQDNRDKGISYHPVDGSHGDYDKLSCKEDIKHLIKKGANR